MTFKLYQFATLAIILTCGACRNDGASVVDYDADLLNSLSQNESTPSSRRLENVPDAVAANVLPNANAPLENSLIVSEPTSLFNGRDLNGWVDEIGGKPKGWEVKDGILALVDPQNGKDLLTDASYSNSVFSFEFRFGKACNSGVKYRIEQPNGKGWVGPEYQIQDDENVDDGRIPDRKIASLFDVFPAQTTEIDDQFAPPTSDSPSGEFRRGKIVVFGDRVEHWLDDQRTLAYTIGSQEWKLAVADSKFKNQKNFGLAASSPLLLQAHGYPVEFRNLEIRTLTPRP